MDKPSECPICYESLENEKTPLNCGHWIHINCVKKHFRPECPLCRSPVNFQVYGTTPPTDISDPPTGFKYDEVEEEESEDEMGDYLLQNFLASISDAERDFLLSNKSSPLYAHKLTREK
jgi:hypothetical protein